MFYYSSLYRLLTPRMRCLWSFHCISATVARGLSQVGLPRKQNWNGEFCAGPLWRSDLWINTYGREGKEAELGRGKTWAIVGIPTKASVSADPMMSSGAEIAHSEWGWGSWIFVLLDWLVIGWELLPSKGITLCLANFSSCDKA